MNILKPSLLIAIAVAVASPLVSASAETIPAGAIILVKTTKAFSSREPSGKPIEGQLARHIGGAAAGAPVKGVVKSGAFNIGSTSRPLTLRLTGIVVKGRTVPITTDDMEMSSTSPWTAGARRVQVTGNAYLVNPGTILQFRLKQPADI
jgi:hypothetical protein